MQLQFFSHDNFFVVNYPRQRTDDDAIERENFTRSDARTYQPEWRYQPIEGASGILAPLLTSCRSEVT